MEKRRRTRIVVAGVALAVAGILAMGGTSPSEDLIFERALNDIDSLPPQFQSIGMALPSGQTRHAGLLGDVDFWVGRGAAAGSKCLFVLPLGGIPEAACGPSVTLELADGTVAHYPIPEETDDADGTLVGGVVLVEKR